MSDPTTPAHPFIRPGQVAADLPAPDHCMQCGQAEATHRASTYMAEASAQDIYLDRKLADIRAREERGDITIREAADARAAALEHHIEAVRELRHEHFGGDAS